MGDYVNGGSYSNNSGGTSSPTSSFNATAGNAILVFVRWEGGDTTASCSDTAGNTYLQIGGGTFQAGSLNAYCAAFYSLNITGNASNVVTVTHGASRTYRRVSAVQYSGLGSYVNYETATGSDASPTGSGLSASATGLLFSGVGTFSFKTATLAGDLANFRNFGSGSDLVHDGDYVVPGSGIVTGAFSLSSTAQWRIINALFSDSSSAEYTITGDVTINSTIGATMEYNQNPSITGDVTINSTIAATMEYNQNPSITGDVTINTSIASAMEYTSGYSITGDVTINSTIAATMEYNQNPSITGDVTINTSIASDMVYNFNAQIAGALQIDFTIAAAMSYTSATAPPAKARSGHTLLIEKEHHILIVENDDYILQIR